MDADSLKELEIGYEIDGKKGQSIPEIMTAWIGSVAWNDQSECDCVQSTRPHCPD
jgi:hypothetical protein